MPTPLTHTPSLIPSPLVPLAKSLKVILLAGVIGAGAGLLASQIIHPRWSAKMTIQLGQISVPDAKGSLVAQALENQLTAAERYNLPSFRLQVLNELGLPAPESGARDADLAFDSLKAAAGRSPNVINVQVSAYSREAASQTTDAALRIFSATHRKVFEQAVSAMQSNLASMQTKLAAAEQEYARLNDTLKAGTMLGSAATNNAREVLISNTAALVNAQILELRQQVAAYQVALSPLSSYPTRAMGPSYVPTRPSTPGIAFFAAAGAGLGLMLGVGLVLLKNSSCTS